MKIHPPAGPAPYLPKPAGATRDGSAAASAGHAPGAEATHAAAASRLSAPRKDQVDLAAAAVMSKYDLRHISYTDLVRAAGELVQVGALPQSDYLDFIGPSPEFAAIGGDRRNPYWNAPQDLVGRHEQQLAIMKSTGAEQRFIDFEQHILSLYQRFWSMQGPGG